MNNTNTLYVCFVKNKHLLPREIIEMLKNNDKDIQVEEIQTNVLVFKNGEIRPQIETSVRKKDVILISTMEENINIELVKTMLYINALHLAGAERIELWMPFFYYGRQDKTGDKREPVSAAMFASTYEKFGVSQFVTVHVHNEAIQGFFQNQFDKLGTKKLFWKHIENFCMERDSFSIKMIGLLFSLMRVPQNHAVILKRKPAQVVMQDFLNIVPKKMKSNL